MFSGLAWMIGVPEYVLWPIFAQNNVGPQGIIPANCPPFPQQALLAAVNPASIPFIFNHSYIINPWQNVQLTVTFIIRDEFDIGIINVGLNKRSSSQKFNFNIISLRFEFKLSVLWTPPLLECMYTLFLTNRDRRESINKTCKIMSGLWFDLQMTSCWWSQIW